MLLIPETIRRIKAKAVEEGWQQALEQLRREARETGNVEWDAQLVRLQAEPGPQRASDTSTGCNCAHHNGPSFLLIPETIRRRAKAREEAWQKGFERGLVQGRVEGADRTNAEWEAWFARYRDAQANGREFTEPTPSARKGS